MHKINIKKESSRTTLDKLEIGKFIDNSGSTGSNIKDTNILSIENDLLKNFKTEKTIYWNTEISFTNSAGGGTNPCVILENQVSKKKFDSSDVIILCTDGEISDNDVKKFAEKLKSYSNKLLFLCLIVNNSLDDYSKINVSVVAPLMLTNNVLCLYHAADKNKTFIIGSKGTISQTYKNPISFNNLETINIDDILKVELSTQQIPSKYLILNEINDEYICVDTSNLFESKTLDLNEEEWNVLIKYSLVNNKLDDLRIIINTTQRGELSDTKEYIKKNFKFDKIKQKSDITTKMVEAYMSKNIEEQQKLKLELELIRDSVRKEELEYMKYIKEKSDVVNKKWNFVKNLLFQVESKDKYSLNNFSLSSNRANRAKEVDDDEEDEKICFGDSPEIDCVICASKGPFVLWISKQEDVEYCTSDHTINYPLDHYEKLINNIVCNPVCGECADSYINYTKLSVYRENIFGYIPVNWDISSNVRYSTKMLCKAFTGNKLLHHVKLLLLSIIDDCNKEWLFCQQYIKDSLINNIRTNNTFSEEGNKVVLREAIDYIITDETNFLRQKFVPSMRLLKFNYEYCKDEKQNRVSILQKRFAYLLIELYSSYVKNSDNNSVNDQIDNIIFETNCGIPIENKNSKININNSKIDEFLKNKIFKEFLKKIPQYEKYITPEFLTNVFWNLSNLNIHERPNTIYLNLMKNDMFRNIGFEKNIYSEINDAKFGRYKKISFKTFPTYCFNNGCNSAPSKLWFYDTELWDRKWNGKYVDVNTIVNVLSENLTSEMASTFGSCYPDSKSAHVMLHKIVATVLTTEFPKDEKMSDDMVIKCMKKFASTKGNHGNIYTKDLMLHVILTIENFIQIRKTKDYSIGNESDKSRKHKIISELHSYGFKFQDDKILFDESKIQKMKLIEIKDDSNIDKIIKRINENYKSDINKSNKKIKMTIDDNLVIGDKNIKIDDYLEEWNKEQSDVIKNVDLSDKIKFQDIKLIGGLDVSFSEDEEDAVACLVVYDFKTLEIKCEFSIKAKVYLPYKAGYLAFREAPLYLKLIEEIKTNYSECIPDVLLFDGNGVWHPRGCGISSHFSILSGIPSLGIAKKVLVADGINDDKVQVLLNKSATKKGEFVKVIGDSGRELGYALNSTGTCKNSIYVSAGSYISQETAIKIVCETTKFKNNETIRGADFLSRFMVGK